MTTVGGNKTTTTLADNLLNASKKQFTGKLNVGGKAQQWSFFFCMGRVVWATGGIHCNRRFYRLWHQFCPGVSQTGIKLREEDFVACYNYQIMAVLSIRKKLTSQQKSDMVLETLREVIFDIFQVEKTEDLSYSYDAKGAIDTSLTLMSAVVRAEQVLPLVELLWSDWQKSGLAAYSPNLVPVLKNLEDLKKVTSPKAYQTLIKAIDGKKTFRDLAVLIKQDLRKLTLYLIPYARKGIMDIKWLPDSKQPDLARGVPPSSSSQTARSIPQEKAVNYRVKATIVCVDDRPQVCQQMQQILEEAGYKFIGIQDSIKALPTLIETKPDLIFLDLIMPVANGYEICTQIRRVSWFKETPVIILTSNDGILDRVRAKMVGCSDFMAKPVNAEKVLAAVKKHLEPSSSEPHNLAVQTLAVGNG